LAVVFDGFGTAALRVHSRACPNLQSLAKLHFMEIRAVPPPKTPVNFASMATGASQELHGIGEKTDPLRAETVFEVLSEEGLTSCVAGRQSGSPANLFSGVCQHRAIAQSNTDEEVLLLVLETIANSDPSFTLVQFLDIDNAGHRAGPMGSVAEKAILGTDMKLGSLIQAIAVRDFSLIVLADHGQHSAKDECGNVKGRHDGSAEADFQVPLAWSSAKELSGLARNLEAIWTGRSERQYI
jgi:predicted AlkP superfamily pyrophosphatase or phosphodiesterase